MNDPFRTLGVDASAREDEIKSAYRRLAKQYHPDLHPGDQTAERKMQEINEAYAEAMRIRHGGSYDPNRYGEHARQASSSGNGGWGGAGYGNYTGSRGGSSGYGGWDGGGGFDPFGFGSFWTTGTREKSAWNAYTTTGEYDDPELQAAADYIKTGRYTEALHTLERMTRQGAAWHYLTALANLGLGSRMNALNHARQAVDLDPGKAEYQNLYEQLRGSGTVYERAGGGSSCSLCDNSCLTCIGVNLLCNCLCGSRMIWCC